MYLRRLLCSFFVAFLALGLTACNNDDDTSSSSSCATDEDCPGDEVCMPNGSCQLMTDGGAPDGSQADSSTSPDAGTPDTTSTDAGMPDGSSQDTAPDPDTSGTDTGMADTGKMDTAPNCDPRKDPDGDGLDNCEESAQGTDPMKADTDGDGLRDGAEVFGSHNTDPTNPDTDGDGLDDGKEVNGTKTDPTKKDTDGDGLSDAAEVNTHNTDPNKADSDGDGLSDGAEVTMHNSDPNKADTDGDGLNDGDEVNQHGSDPTKKDTDGDGLSDDAEINNHNTDPTKKDTDGDGLSDDAEVNNHGTDPTKSDTDGDGLSDDAEIQTHMTAATKKDSDMDGLDDGAEVMFGSDPTKSDTDGDGLSDAAEKMAGSNPNKTDTDGDGLSDGDEVNKHSTDPTKKDTDGDNLNDDEELKFGLDPNKKSTFNDGTNDGNRSFVQRCQMGSANLNTKSDSTGDYSLTLPSDFNSYTQLTVSTSTTQSPKAAAAFSDQQGDVHGFIFSVTPSSSSGVEDRLAGYESSLDTAQRSIERVWFDSPYTTHDGHDAIRAKWDVTYSSGRQAEGARDDLMFALAPFSSGDVSGLPSASGSSDTDWRAHLTLIDRGTKLLVVGALATSSDVSATPSISHELANATGSGAVAKNGTSTSLTCQGTPPRANKPKAEFYWVLDQSGSMNQENNDLRNLSTDVTSALQTANLDYRLGVTNMDRQNNGHLRNPPAWTTSASQFGMAIQNGVINCQTNGGWNCSGGREYGLESAKSGLTYMLGNGSTTPSTAEAIRSNADVYTIFLTDEEANSIKNDGKAIQPFVNFFTGKTTAFSIASYSNSSCAFDDAKSYRDVAMGTDGAHASVCKSRAEYKDMLEKMIVRAAAKSSGYTLNGTPIPSTLTVWVNGNMVSRSRTNGWEHLSGIDSITFFGNSRPQTSGSGSSGDHVAIIYETY